MQKRQKNHLQGVPKKEEGGSQVQKFSTYIRFLSESLPNGNENQDGQTIYAYDDSPSSASDDYTISPITDPNTTLGPGQE